MKTLSRAEKIFLSIVLLISLYACSSKGNSVAGNATTVMSSD